MHLGIRRILAIGLGGATAYAVAVCVTAATFSFDHTATTAVMSWVAVFVIPAASGSSVAWAGWRGTRVDC